MIKDILDLFCKRRQINTDSVFILYSGFYDFDSLNNFNVNPNFFYLSNLDIPNLIIIYNNNELKFFYKFNNPKWFDDESLLKNIEKIYGQVLINDFNALNLSDFSDKEIYSFKNGKKFRTRQNNWNFKILDDFLNETRLIKHETEIENIKLATRYTSNTFTEVFKNINKYKYCYQIVNDFKCILGYQNIHKLAYQPICTVGEDNKILHSHNYSKKLRGNDLILLDIGCKYNNYCSDITRTFPVNKVFTPIQKKIYNIVLKINKYAIKNAINNKDWLELTYDCYKLIYSELNKINLVKELYNDDDKIEIGRIFMIHGLGHSVGLEVHDSGDLRILKKNMVIAIEPGIYFDKSQLSNKNVNINEWEKYEIIGGVRIEDMIRVDDNQSENLTSVPKCINEIESLLNR